MLYSMDPILPEHPVILLLGSMPGAKSLETQQYYAHPRNHFWPILERVTGIPFTASDYETKVKLLKEHRIALWDVIGSCEREGSLDSRIKKENPNDIGGIFKKYTKIRACGLNGTKAYTSFTKYVTGDEVYITKLPSTSPIPGKNVLSFEEKVEVWRDFLQPYLKQTI
ncbi:DNA-deoxyinosine glycosylase [Alkalicoccus urumqiensis]|uniref:DNA-deoxyinosine glycosylase n=1 Tax=Alkalicoccus urumqiensis TaxID=1548213 RepID=A0A2P6MKX3_ALKUR|nr:DNA-deoxyinosine glycosylase [Alkalicoccus urumqiensis]PRO66932.1 DNA-deoxyinosine glycosylase [Alkalicoccus urumqiensis]